MKPFTFQALRDKLDRYAEYRTQMRVSGQAAAQSEVDRAFAALRGASASSLPTGCSEETLEVVARHVQNAGQPASAVEVGAFPNSQTVGTRRTTLLAIATSGLASSSAARR